MAQAGAARCATVRATFDETSKALGMQAVKRDPAWLKEAVIAYDKVARSGKRDAYSQLLTRRFERDERMDLREAWALQLIDAVEGVNSLSSEPARLTEQPIRKPAVQPPCDVRTNRLAA